MHRDSIHGRRLRALLALSLAALGACASAPAASDRVEKPLAHDPEAEAAIDKYERHRDMIEDPEEARRERAIGVYLAELDLRIRAWNQLVVESDSRDDLRKLDAIEQDVRRRVRERLQPIVMQLESGPPSNRVIAAKALGFGAREVVLSPLLAALADSEGLVVANALASLSVLAHPQTPLGEVAERLARSSDENARANAASAIRTVWQAGQAPTAVVLETVRGGLVDPSPIVRGQCALALGLALDEESVPRLALLLGDETPYPASAAARALVLIGKRKDTARGPCARGLVAALDSAGTRVRPHVMRALRDLSRMNYGEDVKAWTEWAHRLP